MNVNDMTFGVELEVTLPRNVIVNVGGYHHGSQIPQLPAGWNAQSDCSINANARGHMGVEIVSPVLKGADGIRQLVAVCNWLNSVGAKVNRSTGFHVHVGWTSDSDALARLVTLVACHEKALFAVTGTHSREVGHYCQGVRNDHAYQTLYRDERRNAETYTDRYRVLNLRNLQNTSGKRTVEFRVFAGTTHANKVIGYVRLCLALVEKAILSKRKTNWIPKQPVATSPVARKGAGQTEVARMFYAIGWTKGREDRAYGNVELSDAPTISEHKKEMMRLAKKYDGGAND